MQIESTKDTNRIVGIGPLAGWDVKAFYSEALTCREQLSDSSALDRIDLIAHVLGLTLRCGDESICELLRGIADEMSQRSHLLAALGK